MVVLTPEGVRYGEWLEESGASVTRVASCDSTLQMVCASDTRLDAVVLETHLPDGCGLMLAEELSVRQPHCRIVVIDPTANEAVMDRVCAIPGATLLSGQATKVELVFAVKENAASPPLLLRQLLKQLGDDVKLSPQQERVFWLNLWGYADQEIAEALTIQLHTVQDYQLALRRKTGARSKASYLRLLLEYQGVRPPR
jgi:DNA-binding NarL/FixJ family response regulator